MTMKVRLCSASQRSAACSARGNGMDMRPTQNHSLRAYDIIECVSRYRTSSTALNMF